MAPPVELDQLIDQAHLATVAISRHTIGANNLQLNPATRTAWTLGPGQQQLAPFGY